MNTENSPKSEVLIEKALADHTQRNSKPRRGRKPKAESEKKLQHTVTFRTDNPHLAEVVSALPFLCKIADLDNQSYRLGDALELAVREYLKTFNSHNNTAIKKTADTLLRQLDGGHHE